MRFKNLNVNIPKEKRIEYNEKILYLISTNNDTLTNEEIYNYYSEKGGNHNLIFSNYDNYYEFSKKKKEIEEGQFFTPDSIIEQMYNIIKPNKNNLIADLTAGKGNFINHCPNVDNFYANEIDKNCVAVMKKIFPEAKINCQSIQYYNPNTKFDIIFGNPPFNIYINDIYSQFYYIYKSAELLLNGGILCVLVPESFIDDEFFNKTSIEKINESFSFITQYRLHQNAFDNANIKTKVMIFYKNSENLPKTKYKFIYDTYENAVSKYNNIKTLLDKESKKLKLENIKLTDNNYSFSNPKSNTINGFDFKLRKYMYELKTHFPNKLQKAYEYIHRFETQTKPSNIEDKDWDRIKITENKVIAYIKKLLTYKKHKTTKVQCLSDKTTRRKERFIAKHQCLLNIKQDKNIDKFLSKNIVEHIILTDKQKFDTNIVLQRNYTYLQWEQGCGKTITGIYQILYRIKNNNVKNVFIIAPAIAIKTTWREYLKKFNIDFFECRKYSDFYLLSENNVILLTLDMVSKLKRILKKYIKIINQNCFLLFDEADFISSIDSIKYKSVLSVFRKVKYKTLMSGTMTRNNIAEAFTQFELLYNNSDFFKFTPMMIYQYNKSKELECVKNDDQDSNFKPYKKGFSQFKSAYSPEKTTVFGIKKQNQDIYNSQDLKLLINNTIITRTFEDIVGKDKYSINQITCRMSLEEKLLYKKILFEFITMKNNYFKELDNKRKDTMLNIIRQLNLLFKACSIPQTFVEYKSNECTKLNKIINLIKEKQFNKFAIGTIRVQTANIYYEEIKKHFPNHEIYIVVGGNTSIEKRQQIIKEIENKEKIILISTQQSLSCSINVDCIDTMILPELQWNHSKSSQYYHRIVRFNSKNKKQIYYVTYENSIESNLLQLILNKEKLVQFLKNNETNINELYEKFNINFDLIDMLLYKEKETDSKGNVITNIVWKESSIA